ncbi:MAG: hypothetical protein R3E14_00685 [Erythrobacter sp.]
MAKEDAGKTLALHSVLLIFWTIFAIGDLWDGSIEVSGRVDAVSYSTDPMLFVICLTLIVGVELFALSKIVSSILVLKET